MRQKRRREWGKEKRKRKEEEERRESKREGEEGICITTGMHYFSVCFVLVMVNTQMCPKSHEAISFPVMSSNNSIQM